MLQLRSMMRHPQFKSVTVTLKSRKWKIIPKA
jgi:hypothetical protein